MRGEKRYYVYIMSSRSRTLYTGVTGDIFSRSIQHKRREIDGFTKKYRIDRLVYYETFKYVNNAIAREKQIKAWTRAKRVALIESMNPTWQDLAEGWGEPIKLQIPRSQDLSCAEHISPIPVARDDNSEGENAEKKRRTSGEDRRTAESVEEHSMKSLLTNRLSRKPAHPSNPCHPERSEGSAVGRHRPSLRLPQQAMAFRVVTSVLLLSMAASAEDWHRVGSSSCLQIKAKGAKVSGRPFAIYGAPNSEPLCCEGLTVKARGKTEDFGHFRILGLDRGRYFLNLDLKTKQVSIPISVDYLVDKKDVSRDCEPNYKITVDKKTSQAKWEEFFLVD